MISLGKIYPTNCGTNVKIVGYTEDTRRVIIQWLDDRAFIGSVFISHLKRGKISNPFHKSVIGVGYLGEYAGRTVELRLEYSTWHAMMARAYCLKYKAWKPTYSDCFVNDSWHSFTAFCEWTGQQPMWGVDSWQLDKDLLVKGNKQYSKDHCVMLPQEVNQLLVTSKGSRGPSLIGVSYDVSRNKYMAQGGLFRKKLPKKRFSTEFEAFSYYKKYKELAFQEAANCYKHVLDERAYYALLNRMVETTD